MLDVVPEQLRHGRIDREVRREERDADEEVASTAITSRVVAAFRDSGGLKAGTPVAIASVPVSATAPEATRAEQEDRGHAGGVGGGGDHLGRRRMVLTENDDL